MPSRGPAAFHQDRALTTMMIAWSQAHWNHATGNAAPVIPSEHKSGVYYEWSLDDLLRIHARRKGGKEPYPEMMVDVAKRNFVIPDPLATSIPLDDDEAANQDAVLRLEQTYMSLVTDDLWQRAELEFAKSALVDSVWSKDLSGTDDGSGSSEFVRLGEDAADIHDLIEDEKVAMSERAGYEPNELVVARDLWGKIKNDPKVRDQIKHTSSEPTTPEMFARYVGVERVTILNATHVTSRKGAASTATSFIGGNNQMLLLYRPPAPSTIVPSAMYSFAWRGRTGNDLGLAGGSFRDDDRELTSYRGRFHIVHKVTAAPLGIRFKDVHKDLSST